MRKKILFGITFILCCFFLSSTILADNDSIDSEIQQEDELSEDTAEIVFQDVLEENLPDISTSKLGTAASYNDYSEFFRGIEEFGMGHTVTRNELALFLAQYCGADVSNDSFGDTYSSSVDWAVSHLVMMKNGYDFRGAEAVTREELSLALQSVAEIQMVHLPEINERYSLLDNDQFSRLGREAAAFMQQSGIMIEDKNGCFEPFHTVSVIELESIMLRFLFNDSQDFIGLPCQSIQEKDDAASADFSSACFIGHSQVVGMKNYFHLDNPDYYAVVGHTASQVLEFEWYEMPDGHYGKLSKVLHNFSYDKVYIMLGINDCTDKTDRIAVFREPMIEILDMVKETQPDAEIYLISLAPVGRYTRYNVYYNPQNTTLYSQAVKTLAREYGAEYLDVHRLLSDKEGYILDLYNAGDGIHIQASQYSVLEDYFKTHQKA